VRKIEELKIERTRFSWFFFFPPFWMPSKKQVLREIRNALEVKKWKLSMDMASIETGIQKTAGKIERFLI